MLSKTVVHAVRALMALAESNHEFRGTSAVADETDSPRNYLGKLLQQLARHGLVESQKGFGGGFRLARDPAEISLYDVMGAIEDTGRWSACILGRQMCSDSNPCPVHAQWAPVRDAYLNVLRNTKITDLVLGAGGSAVGPFRASKERFDQGG